MLHEQLQRLELFRPACLDTRLLREHVEVHVGNGLDVTEDIFNA